jgi:hypothetical protein
MVSYLNLMGLYDLTVLCWNLVIIIIIQAEYYSNLATRLVCV